MKKLLLLMLLCWSCTSYAQILPTMLDWQIGYGYEYVSTEYQETDEGYIVYPIVAKDTVQASQRYSLYGLNLSVNRAYDLLDRFYLDLATQFFWSMNGSVDFEAGPNKGSAQVGSAWNARFGGGLRYVMDANWVYFFRLDANYWLLHSGRAEKITLPYTVYTENFSEQLISLGAVLAGRYYWHDIHFVEAGVGLNLFSLYGDTSYKIITGTPELQSSSNVGIFLRYGINI